VDAMLEHGCDDIRVVCLTARTVMGAEQGKEAVQHDGPLLYDMEDLPETLLIPDCGADR
jgi:hypothetical protein